MKDDTITPVTNNCGATQTNTITSFATNCLTNQADSNDSDDTDTIDAVILAAGLSSRSTTYKMELMFDKTSLIEKCVQSFIPICTNIFVVCGYNANIIKDLLSHIQKIQIINNVDYLDGMFSSVKAGLQHVTSKRFFLTPGDYPFFTTQILLDLKADPSQIVIPTYNNKKGHPILMDSHLIPEILNFPSSQSLRDFISQKKHKLLPVNSSGILTDIDTIEDYNRSLKIIPNLD